MWTLQEELSTAQSQLQEVQDDLTELRKALEETQSQLTDREAEKALIQTGGDSDLCDPPVLTPFSLLLVLLEQNIRQSNSYRPNQLILSW